jgi:Tol biopolymer transport system component
MKVDPQTLRATDVDRLTTGPGPDARVAVSADGRRLAYTAKSQRIRSWLFPFDATTGQIRGNGDAITSSGRMSLDPVLSADGTTVVYFVPHGESSGPSFGDVRNELWLKSLVDGLEAPVISDDIHAGSHFGRPTACTWLTSVESSGQTSGSSWFGRVKAATKSHSQQ